MRGIRILVLITSLFVFVSSAAAITMDFDGAEYVATTAENIKVGWTASTFEDSKVCADCEYEFRIYHVDRKTYTIIGTSKSLEQSFKLPKSGHYWPEVRGCIGTGATRECSDWATSVNIDDKPMVNGNVKVWRIYGKPAPAGTITITK